MGERKREKERELEIRSGMRRSVGYHKSQVWAAPVSAVIEEEEEEEDEEVAFPETKSLTQIDRSIPIVSVESASESENGMVVDPSEYLFAHSEAAAEAEEEEAWFEEQWRDLQADNQGHPQIQSITTTAPFSAVTTEVSVQIYSVESESDLDEPIPSSSIHDPTYLQISPPPSPKLSPTRLQDKLETPMEFGTKAASLQSAIAMEEFERVWEVRELGEMFVMPIPADFGGEEDVPVLGEDSEEDGSDEEKDDELLITPGEETLDEFGSASYESEVEEMRLIGVKGKA